MKPARFCFCVGSLCAPVPFSSDALGMPWELMGVYSFFRIFWEKLVWEVAQAGRILQFYIEYWLNLCKYLT